MSTEERLSDQRSRADYAPALLEKIFEMGRYWFMLTGGQYPSMSAEVNANIDLEISPGPQGDRQEGMEACFSWMESLAPDFRVNVRTRGEVVLYHCQHASSRGCGSLEETLRWTIDLAHPPTSTI